MLGKATEYQKLEWCHLFYVWKNTQLEYKSFSCVKLLKGLEVCCWVMLGQGSDVKVTCQAPAVCIHLEPLPFLQVWLSDGCLSQWLPGVSLWDGPTLGPPSGQVICLYIRHHHPPHFLSDCPFLILLLIPTFFLGGQEGVVLASYDWHFSRGGVRLTVDQYEG